MRACATGATGFVGAHVVRALAERGDDVRVVYRNPERLKALTGVKFRRAKSDVLDYRATCSTTGRCGARCAASTCWSMSPGSSPRPRSSACGS